MISIEKQLDAFYRDTTESIDYIIDGSDEHLDLILSITRPLDRLSEEFGALNENLYNEIGAYSDEEIRFHLMPKLMEVNRSCLTLLGAIRTSMLYSDVRQSVKKFSKNLDFFREMLHDLKHFRINKDQELDNLLNELNAI